jgi:hypothetical protein
MNQSTGAANKDRELNVWDHFTEVAPEGGFVSNHHSPFADMVRKRRTPEKSLTV